MLQARNKTIEADLAATKAELEEVQLRERQLQARNALLERVATLNNTDVNAHPQVSMQSQLATGSPSLPPQSKICPHSSSASGSFGRMDGETRACAHPQSVGSAADTGHEGN